MPCKLWLHLGALGRTDQSSMPLGTFGAQFLVSGIYKASADLQKPWHSEVLGWCEILMEPSAFDLWKSMFSILFFFFLIKKYFIFCVWEFFLRVCLCITYMPDVLGGEIRSLKLKLQMVMSHNTVLGMELGNPLIE